MENRNLQWSKRAKVPLILIFSVNTNHESVAYRSFSPSKYEARGARKVTTGIATARTHRYAVPVGWKPNRAVLARTVPGGVTSARHKSAHGDLLTASG
jgi:hypothetical protein